LFGLCGEEDCGAGLKEARDKTATRDFKCRFEMIQGHVSGFDLMFTVLIPGDEWVSNRLFIVILFDDHGLSLSGPTARVMIVISYLTVMQMLMLMLLLLHAQCTKPP
jgi:hypothetical protein